jgi:hypothetical protein
MPVAIIILALSEKERRSGAVLVLGALPTNTLFCCTFPPVDMAPAEGSMASLRFIKFR